MLERRIFELDVDDGILDIAFDTRTEYVNLLAVEIAER
jgi:hypothetical protein